MRKEEAIMSDDHGSKIRCPQCATLYDANPTGCPHCGLPGGGEERRQHIEQLLDSMSQTPGGGSPIRSDPASLAFSGIRPNVPGAPPAGLQWEEPPDKPDAGAKPDAVRSGRLAAVLVGGFLLLIAIVIALAFALRAALGYRATPETLFAGLQQAMEEGDTRLYLELISPNGTNVDELLESIESANSSYFLDMRNYSLIYNDVILGESGDTALVVATLHFELSQDMDSSYGYPRDSKTVLLLCRENGRWYLDSSYSNAFGLPYISY